MTARAPVIASVLWVLGAPLACSRPEGTAHVRVEDPQVYLMSDGRAGALYARIANDGDGDDRLVGVDSPEVAAAQLHEMVNEGDLAMMKPAGPDGFVVPSRGSLSLVKGGKHAMLFGIAVSDGGLPLTLHFARSGAMTIRATRVPAIP